MLDNVEGRKKKEERTELTQSSQRPEHRGHGAESSPGEKFS
jgi:hypothetical protein